MDSSPASKRDKYVARVVVDQPFNYGGILPPRTIRLIRLLLGEDAEPLHFSLIEKPLDVEPGYLALSYVWGDPSETRIVYCDNREFKVTTNLYCALRQIRKNGINNFLWIDAICINQMNQEEKANQVRLMREIYKQALEVIIWLGEERDTDRSALPLMHQIHAAVQASDSEWSERVSDLDCEALGLPPFSAPSWAALWSLLQREWFSRVWVAQEYFMARSCSILCGPLHISSEVLFSVALTIRNHPNLLIQLTLYVNFSNKAIPINGAGLLALVKAKYLQGTQYDLMSLMRVTKSMRASDPRDKVFALVGIASDVPTNLIDYEKSIVEMNIEIARKYLAENEMGRKGLYLLCFVSGHRSDEKCATLPSWVPELSFHSFYVTPLTFLASLPRQAPLPQSEVSLNGNILQALGRVIDTVSATLEDTAYMDMVQSMGKDGSVPRSIWCKVESWLTCCNNLLDSSKPYPTKEDSNEVFCRTLVFNTAYDGTIAPNSYKECYDAWRKMLRLLSQRYELQSGAGHDPTVHYYRLTNSETPTIVNNFCENRPLEIERLDMASTPFQQALDRFIIGRKFFSSKQGFIGWVPFLAQTGDKICIFQGCDIPYVIRPCDDGDYTLIGAVYIHGLMYGEAIKLDHAPLEQIRLI